ncbi:endoplasmic reticulum junction formation protein lunapark isoform X2 [Varanus komodoensis]|uniref:Endoplasmic reticulum junction formation protein lunapark n=1 Tax=Varanus komodoensis TaxID=61221 RepID=A0A8D2J1N4_VARKO|nr:endoplasmic reticulum junction formation protein lunapark isoform X2 [Varanus komodoensis]XP_044282962.1 endoplasmic reticulum junction formation protein lunapark isoform X2 [Varanus komodoensis]XP_044282963.1 endoplasmic reticulum junction formation protein lunapark isoform X2 [Varanus komodoensis]
MGGIISRWRQAKPSTVEVLEKIDKDIQALEEFREKNQRQQKLWVGRFLLYSSLLYLVSCLIIYLWYLPDEWTARFIMTLPLFAFPLIVWSIRTLLIFVFSKRTERNNEALEDLKLQKKKILEEVMEKETYKAAKLILERFDPEAKKAKDVEPPSAGASAVPGPGQELRHRTPVRGNVSAPIPVTPKQGSPKMSSPVPPSPGPQREISAPGGPPERTATSASQPNILPRHPGSRATSMPGMGLHPPGPPLARPILPRERGALDRIVEYLVGDGPQNRYALICQQCFSHNGMALKEEFEYIAFRCAYCFFLNPARKTKPQAPRLPDFSAEKKQPEEIQNGTETETLKPEEEKLQDNQMVEELLEEATPPTEENDSALPAEEHSAKVVAAAEVEQPTSENSAVANPEPAIPADQKEEPLADD